MSAAPTAVARHRAVVEQRRHMLRAGGHDTLTERIGRVFTESQEAVGASPACPFRDRGDATRFVRLRGRARSSWRM